MSKKKSPKKSPANKTAGRPAGQPNHEVAHATAVVTACPKCGSTEREPYYNRRELRCDIAQRSGEQFTHVVWRRTKCLACGQVRDDRHLENRP